MLASNFNSVLNRSRLIWLVDLKWFAVGALHLLGTSISLFRIRMQITNSKGIFNLSYRKI